jgi:hypothetical protein
MRSYQKYRRIVVNNVEFAPHQQLSLKLMATIVVIIF